MEFVYFVCSIITGIFLGAIGTVAAILAFIRWDDKKNRDEIQRRKEEVTQRRLDDNIHSH